ncbi:MAG: HNH endonuclease [Chloroflexi bacterium]|nr:HNH endonuclease [Chloroflexota bacterium]
MSPKHLRAKRAYDRRYRRENSMSRHRDRAYGANRRYGGPKLKAADVAAIFAKSARCYYCRAPVDDRTGTLEHIDAALGNNPTNLTVACQPCNRGKHARPKSIWLKQLATRGIRHEDLPDNIPVQRRML